MINKLTRSLTFCWTMFIAVITVLRLHKQSFFSKLYGIQAKLMG